MNVPKPSSDSRSVAVAVERLRFPEGCLLCGTPETRPTSVTFRSHSLIGGSVAATTVTVPLCGYHARAHRTTRVLGLLATLALIGVGTWMVFASGAMQAPTASLSPASTALLICGGGCWLVGIVVMKRKNRSAGFTVAVDPVTKCILFTFDEAEAAARFRDANAHVEES